MPLRICILLALLLCISCKSNEYREFGSDFNSYNSYPLEIEDLREASGLVSSSLNKDILFSINDSGNNNEIYMLDYKARDKGRLILQGIKNRDWEDISIGPGPGNDSYIYIAEIGDNLSQFEVKYIYRFKEDKYKTGKDKIHEIKDFDSIRFVFPDGKRDAETILIEPATKDIYIVSKREDTVGIYMARYPQSIDSIITLEKVGKLGYKNVIAGSISIDGTEVLLKTYDNVLYWSKNKNQPAFEVINSQEPQLLLYHVEPQGESITWHPGGDGYFTLSEEPRGIESSLYFYKREKQQKR